MGFLFRVNPDLSTELRRKLFNDMSTAPKVLLIENGNGYPIFPAYDLMNRGYQVINACHGYEALPLAQRHPDLFAAVIVESHLRFMSGEEIAEGLRQIRPTARVLRVYPDQRWPFLRESLAYFASHTVRRQAKTALPLAEKIRTAAA